MGEVTSSLDFPLLLLKIAGLYGTSAKRMFLSTTFYSIALTYIIIVVFLQFLYMDGDILYFAENVEAFSVFAQHFGKLGCLVVSRRRLGLIVEFTKEFWKISECSTQLSNKMHMIQTGNISLQKLYIFIGVTFLGILVILTFFNRPLVFGTWNMNESVYLYNILLTLQNLEILPIGTMILAIDLIFVALCVELTLQFRLLNYKVENLVVGQINSDEMLQSYIKHQNFLLRVLNEVRELYSPILTVEFITITPIICNVMYVFSESNEPGVLMRHALRTSIIMGQIVFYCIPADIVVNEAIQLSNAFYNSKWYVRYEYQLWKLLPLAIQNSQKELLFTAGGFMVVNSNMVVKVLKGAWSAFTVMRAMKN